MTSQEDRIFVNKALVSQDVGRKLSAGKATITITPRCFREIKRVIDAECGPSSVVTIF
jgi:hypothetical protein